MLRTMGYLILARKEVKSAVIKHTVQDGPMTTRDIAHLEVVDDGQVSVISHGSRDRARQALQDRNGYR
jgi:hypothetical protein